MHPNLPLEPDDRFELFLAESQTENCEYQIIQLPSPRTGTWQNVAIYKQQNNENINSICFYQLLKYTSKDPSSWFVGNFVLQDGGLGLLSPIDPIFYLLYFISLIITKENLSNDPCAIPFIPWNQHLLNALEKLSPSPLQKTAILNIFSMNDSINHNWIDTRLEKLCNTKQVSSTILYQPSFRKISSWFTLLNSLFSRSLEENQEMQRLMSPLLHDFIPSKWHSKLLNIDS